MADILKVFDVGLVQYISWKNVFNFFYTPCVEKKGNLKEVKNALFSKSYKGPRKKVFCILLCFYLPLLCGLRDADVAVVLGLSQGKLQQRGDIICNRQLRPTSTRLEDGVAAACAEVGEARLLVHLAVLFLLLIRFPVALALLQLHDAVPAVNVRLARYRPDPALDIAVEVADGRSREMRNGAQVHLGAPAVGILEILRKEAAVQRRLELLSLVLANLATRGQDSLHLVLLSQASGY